MLRMVFLERKPAKQCFSTDGTIFRWSRITWVDVFHSTSDVLERITKRWLIIQQMFPVIFVICLLLIIIHFRKVIIFFTLLLRDFYWKTCEFPNWTLICFVTRVPLNCCSYYLQRLIYLVNIIEKHAAQWI